MRDSSLLRFSTARQATSLGMTSLFNKANRRKANSPRAPLPVIVVSDAADGKIFVEVGPMQAKRRNIDVIELLRRTLSETRVLSDRESQRGATLKNDYNKAVTKTR